MNKHIAIALGIIILLSCIPAASATYKVGLESLNLGTDWQTAKVDGVTALKHTSKSDGILFLDKPICPDDFIITGKIRMNDMLSPYSGLVFGSNGPGADNYHQWRAYFADGGVIQSAWGSITGRITNLDRNKWTDFKLEKRGQNIKLYFSSSLVLEGKLPNLSPDATGGKIGLFGVGDTAFANIVISYPESINSTKPAIKLSSDNMDLLVDTHTGWPVNLLSKSPSPMQLLETKNPFVFYISDQSGKTIDLNKVISGKEDSGRLSFELTPSDSSMQDTCQASITYTAESSFIRCHAELVALKDLPGEYQIRIGFGLKPSDYDYIWYPGIPHDNTFKPTKTGYNKINQDYGSVMNKQGTKKLYFGTLPAEDVQQKSDVPWASLSAPITVAERSDRLIAFASFDTGAPFMFAMDSAGGKGTYPMVLRFPKDITKGQRFVFDINIKTFDRPKNCYTQIMSWFLDNAYSSNPNTADSVGRSKIKIPARAMPSGLNGWGPVGSKPAPGTVLPYEKQMVQAGMAMPWWICGMSVADEMYPLDDRPYFDEVGTRWTKEQIKSELQRIMDAGISPLMYRRAWLIWETCHDDRPPYKSWTLNPQVDPEKRAVEIQKLNPEQIKVYGFDTIHKVPADFNNSDFRNWYVDQVVKELGYYHPSGIWWDMGDSGQAGVIDAMARIRNKAAELYPWMRFVGNEKAYTLDGLQCDAMAIESYEIAGKTERAFQCAKAFKRAVYSLIYSVYYQMPFFILPKENYTSDVVVANDVAYFAMKYRTTSINNKLDSPIITARQSSFRDGTPVTLVSAKDLITDGKWHTLFIPVAGKLTGSPAVAGLAIGHEDKMQVKVEKSYVPAIFVNLPASAALDMETYGFYAKKPTNGILTAPKNANSMIYDNFKTLINWQTPEPVITKAGYATFKASPNQPATWMKTDFRPLYRGFARGLALGAFPGLGPAEPNFPIMQPVFDFANIAMKLNIVQEPMAAWPNSNNIRASIWAGINRVMIASYNTSRKPLNASLDIDLPLLVREYGYTGKLDMDSITSFNASTGTRAAKGFIVQRLENGHVKISGKLGSNELLLVYAR